MERDTRLILPQLAVLIRGLAEKTLIPFLTKHMKEDE